MEKEIGWLLKEKYFGKPDKNFKKDIKRLKKGEPLDYVIGFTEFLGCKIDLSKKPLIPRKETEFWVEAVIKNLKIEKLKIRCLDMFAGSGCIGIAILKHVRNAKVDFADIENHVVGQRVIKSDVFKEINPTSLKLRGAKYDYIFANPPYIPTSRRNLIQKSVLKYEPSKALFGGKDGLLFIKKFLKNAKNYLEPSGVIFMEFSPEQKNKIEKLLKKYKYKSWQFNKDQYGKWRWVNAAF